MRLPEHIKPFPSTPLQRPFKLFGSGFEVKLSSSLTMLPDTVVWAAAGMSLQQAIEACGPEYGRAMKALKRAAKGPGRLSSTTLANFRRLFFGAPALAHLPRKPTQEELLSSIPSGNAWEILHDTMSEGAGSDLYDYVQRLAELEALSDRIRNLFVEGSESQANELLRQEIGHPELYWAQFRLPIQTIFVLDATLQVLAGVERKRTPSSEKIGDSNASPVLALMADGRKPLGHWLVQQEESIDCSSLDQLSGKLGDIDRDRLADWSSERHLLGPKKASALLKKLGNAVDVDLEMRRYRNARFFSFLIDFVISATEGVPPEWPEAQAMVRNRYRELLEPAIPA
jgi:hypothetical protein